MPDLGDYSVYVLGAYAATIGLVVALVLVTWVTSRRAKARLASAEARS